MDVASFVCYTSLIYERIQRYTRGCGYGGPRMKINDDMTKRMKIILLVTDDTT